MPALSNRRAEHAREIGGELRQIGRLVARDDPASLDAGEVQQRVHEPLETERVAMRHLLPFAVHGRQRRAGIAQPVLERTHQQRERRAELVADVAEEVRFRPIQFGKRLGAPALLFVRAGIEHAGSHLVGDEVHEHAILVIERPSRVESHDQSGGRTGFAGRRQRQVLHQVW
jgi:hypothetical protein